MFSPFSPFRRFLVRVDVFHHVLFSSVWCPLWACVVFLHVVLQSVHPHQLGWDPSIGLFRTDFAALSLSLHWIWPNHDSRVFTRKLFIGFMCAFSRMVTFLMWCLLVFPCIHLSIFISIVFIWFCSHFLIAKHSQPYVIAGPIAVL